MESLDIVDAVFN